MGLESERTQEASTTRVFFCKYNRDSRCELARTRNNTCQRRRRRRETHRLPASLSVRTAQKRNKRLRRVVACAPQDVLIARQKVGRGRRLPATRDRDRQLAGKRAVDHKKNTEREREREWGSRQTRFVMVGGEAEEWHNLGSGHSSCRLARSRAMAEQSKKSPEHSDITLFPRALQKRKQRREASHPLKPSPHPFPPLPFPPHNSHTTSRDEKLMTRGLMLF